MGPPALLVRFGKSQALGEPDEDVVMQCAALLELGDPDVAKGVAATFNPLANALQEFGDMARLEAVDVPIGEGEHRRANAEAPKGMLKELGGDEDRTLQAGVPCLDRVYLYRLCKRPVIPS
jgi:hypothetical protein